MKINLKPIEENKKVEVELGEKGTPVLLKMRGKSNYVFGRIKGIKKINKKRAFYSRRTRQDIFTEQVVDHLEFLGPSYSFISTQVMGVDFIGFKERNPNQTSFRNPGVSGSRYAEVRRIEEAVSGLDNIISYFENRRDSDFREYAGLFRKIFEANK